MVLEPWNVQFKLRIFLGLILPVKQNKRHAEAYWKETETVFDAVFFP